jgi:hypothetical protein
VSLGPRLQSVNGRFRVWRPGCAHQVARFPVQLSSRYRDFLPAVQL